MVGFTSIAVDSLNSIAQLAAVLKCKPEQRNSPLYEFNHMHMHRTIAVNHRIRIRTNDQLHFKNLSIEFVTVVTV